MWAMSLWAVTPKATRELETNMLDRLGRSIAYLHKGNETAGLFPVLAGLVFRVVPVSIS